MESSYRIIKGGYIKPDIDDKFVIDTELESMEDDEEEIFSKEDVLELNIDNEEKDKIIEELKEYKKKMNMEIEFEKKNILEKALIDAEKEAIAIRETAYEEGYKEGYNKAIEDAKSEGQKIKEDALSILKEAKEYRDNYLKENEENIYILAKTMAENIIHHLIDEDDEKIIGLMRPVLEEYLKEEDITITTSKKGKEILQKHIDSLERLCPNTRFIFLVDKSIEKNGFIIENKESIVDLGIGVQLENMVKAISDIDE